MKKGLLEPSLALAALVVVAQEFRATGVGLWGEEGGVLALGALAAACVLQAACWAVAWAFAPRTAARRARIARVLAQIIAVLLALFSMIATARLAPAAFRVWFDSAYAAGAFALACIALLGWGLSRLPESLARGILAWAIAGSLGVAIVEGTVASLTRVDTVLEAPESDQASVYYIVLDGLAGLPSYPGSIEGARALADRMREDYRRNEFEVFERVHSNFYWTYLSLYSLLDNQLHFKFEAEDKARYELPPLLLFDQMAETGLRPVVYYSDYMNVCTALTAHDPACISYGAVDASREVPDSARYPLHLMGIASRFLKRPILEQKRKLYGKLNSLAVLDELIEDAGRHPRGRFVFAHILIPHEPFLLDAQCRIRSEELWRTDHTNYYARIKLDEAKRRWSAYVEQMECVHGRILRLVERLREAGVYEETTIIVHGDHGARISMERAYGPSFTGQKTTARRFLDFYATLLTVKRGEFSLAPTSPGSPDRWRPLSAVLAELFGWPEAEGVEFLHRKRQGQRIQRPHVPDSMWGGAPSTSGEPPQPGAD